MISLVSSFVSTILDLLCVRPLDNSSDSTIVLDLGGISKLILFSKLVLSWTSLSTFSLFGRGTQSKDHHEEVSSNTKFFETYAWFCGRINASPSLPL